MQTRTIYTIGHSSQDVRTFTGLLKRYSIEVVVDVRSSPYSKYASQFNRKNIQEDIRNNGIKYLFMGREMGGKPADIKFYDTDGYVLYSRIAESLMFIEGIERLLKGITQYRIVLMCSEENPFTCHRRLLIGKVLSDHGVEMLHIRSDGRIQSEEDVSSENGMARKDEAQQRLFVQDNRDEWRSARPVLRHTDAI